jgi:hypothetical protein
VRTTLDIDDDLLATAKKERARRQGTSTGQVVSGLLQRILTGLDSSATSQRTAPRRRHRVAGFEPFPAKPGVTTTDAQVNALRDAEGV